MKNRALEWIIGTVTVVAMAAIGTIFTSFDARITRASDMIQKIDEKRQSNETDIAVMKEILSQINTRTDKMWLQIDKIDRELK